MRSLAFILTLLFLLNDSANSQTIKFEERFDSLNAEARGWLFVNNDSDRVNYYPLQESITFPVSGWLMPMAGNFFIRYEALNANDNGVIDQWAIMPRIEGIEVFDELSFWCGAVDKKYKDSLRVLISTGSTNLNEFVEIDRFKVDGPEGTWHQKKYDLSAYAGRNIYIAVNYFIKDGGALGANSDVMWIDYFVVKNATGPEITVDKFELYQNYPNPFNPSTDIVFDVPQTSDIEINIYDILGRRMETFVKGRYSMGRYRKTWNAGNIPSGVYFYTLTAGETLVTTKQMILRK